MTSAKLTAGAYETSDNILHLWYPRKVDLATEEEIRAFFDEVVGDWIEPCPKAPYLLVNYTNVHIRPDMAEAYATNIQRFQSLVLGTFRYGIPASFTGVAVALGNLRLGARANMFPDERAAREAIRMARKAGARTRTAGS